MATLLNPFLRALDANADSVSGGLLYVFEAGTTNPVTTYSDRAMTTPQAQPLVANAAGEFAGVFVPSGTYKIRVADSGTVVLYENDNVRMADRPDDPVFLDNQAAIIEDAASYAIGTVIHGDKDGSKYEVAASGATDHTDTRDDGTKLYNLTGRNAKAAGYASALPNGAVTYLDGLPYETDSTATGTASATKDLSVDGLKPYGPIYFEHFGLSATVDGSALFPNALAVAAGAAISSHKGTIRLDSAVTYGGITDIRDVHFDLSAGGSIALAGGLTTLPALSANVSKYARSLSFATAHGLAVGDVVVLHNATDGSFYSNAAAPQPEAQDGHMCRVSAVASSTVVEIYHALADDYLAADMDCYKLDGSGVTVSSVSVNPASGGTDPFVIRQHQGVRVQGMEFSPATSPTSPTQKTGLRIHQCFDFNVSGTTSEATEGGNSYPLSVDNSQLGNVYGCTLMSDWHSAKMGGGVDAGSVPVRSVRWSNCNLLSSFQVGAADAHHNVDRCVYKSCLVDSAVSFSGRDNSLVDCTIIGRPDGGGATDGLCVDGSPIGGTTKIHGCTLKTQGDGNAFGLINFSYLEYLQEDWCLDIDNLTVVADGSSTSSMKLVTLGGGSTTPTTKNIDIRIGRVRVQSSDLSVLVNLSGSNDLSAVMTLAIDDYDGPSCIYFNTSATANRAIPMRLPEQRMYEDFTFTTSDTAKLGSFMSFPHSFPRAPDVSDISIYKTDSTAMTIPGGASSPIPYVYEVESNRIQLGLKSSTGGTFSTGHTVRVSARVDIKDF